MTRQHATLPADNGWYVNGRCDRAARHSAQLECSSDLPTSFRHSPRGSSGQVTCSIPEGSVGSARRALLESLAAWEQHRERVHRDAALNDRYRSNLSVINDFVETAIVKCVEGSPQLPTVWGTVDSVRGLPRGFYEQRTLYFRPGTSAAHHRVYFERLVPALERDGAMLQAFFDTVIGPRTPVRTEASNCGDFPIWRVGSAGVRPRSRMRNSRRWSKKRGSARWNEWKAYYSIHWTTAVCAECGVVASTTWASSGQENV